MTFYLHFVMMGNLDCIICFIFFFLAYCMEAIGVLRGPLSGTANLSSGV